MSILILVTGGTFDRDYDELHGTLEFGDTHLPQMLELGRCRLDVEVRMIYLMDSLEMTDAHRGHILEECRRSDARRIVITHGTDTMVQTGAQLAKGLAGLGKTVVLTGAMIPFAFGSSDGLFNLGSALSFAQSLPEGVYVAMNGRVFPWDNCRKNRELGVFEPIR